MIPLFWLVYARIFLGERITVATILAAACIIAGVVMAGAGGGIAKNALKRNTGNKRLATRTS